MAYRNKTYVCFDGDTDMRYYNLMKAWKQNDNTDFNFYQVFLGHILRILHIAQKKADFFAHFSRQTAKAGTGWEDFDKKWGVGVCARRNSMV